ncbi:pilus assembly protein [Nocardioides aquiterrae]|uniref:Pilus assembly protein n=1 Tax=Nocardioides aquiterrae TaxID=203799 RepID=A0ABP4FD64_9ACTN
MWGGVAGRARREERGAAAVEFALVVPFLLLILFGIISYGFMLSVRQSISQAAGEGARAAAVTLVDAKKKDAAIAAIDGALSYGLSCDGVNLVRDGETIGTCTVSGLQGCDDGATCVTVSIKYFYRDHPIVPSILGLGEVMPEVLEYTTIARVS